eukprot:8562155-Pyramimonas_sp.AAC.1
MATAWPPLDGRETSYWSPSCWSRSPAARTAGRSGTSAPSGGWPGCRRPSRRAGGPAPKPGAPSAACARRARASGLSWARRGAPIRGARSPASRSACEAGSIGRLAPIDPDRAI